jgi:hypothetical protein
MKEMISLEDERMARMRENEVSAVRQMETLGGGSERSGSEKTVEDESIIRKELNKVDPSAVVFSESWAAKKNRIRQNSPYGHLGEQAAVMVEQNVDHGSSSVGLYVCYRQNGWRFATRAARCAAYTRVSVDMG